MKLEHPNLPPFEPVLERIYRLVFEGGIDALQRAGLASSGESVLSVIQQSDGARRRFMKGCHYGWDLAQRRIADLVIESELEIRRMRKDLKASLRNRNKQEAGRIEVLISVLASRQIVLRRFADTILYHLFQMKNYAMRHILLEHRIHAIDPVILTRTVKTATRLNREDRLSFYLVSDLTTVVQVGDLVRVNLASEPRGWSLIELKDGHMNSVLNEIIQETRGKLEETHLDAIRERYGIKAAAQAKRMARQGFRQREFERLLETDEGLDLIANLPIKLSREHVAVREYDGILTDLCIEARIKGSAVSTLDNCLRLVILNRSNAHVLGPRGVAHLLYHLQFGVKECTLSSTNTEELEKSKKIFPFFDLVQMNLRAMWPPPIFLWSMPRDVIFDLLFGRSFVFGQLDFDKLFQLAETQGMSMRWAAEEEVKYPNISPLIPGSPGSRGIQVRLESGGSVAEYTLLNGFLARIFLELMSPHQFLELAKSSFSEWCCKQ